jgi:RNA polymerase sigma factor (sigma-70 family)
MKKPQADPSSILTRPSLLEKLTRWDDGASWQRFCEIYSGLIFNFARARGLNEDESEEVVQETLIATARQVPDFHYDPKKCRFKTWLLRLAYGKAMDVLRRRRIRMREVPLDEALNFGQTDAQGMSNDLQEAWDTEWQTHIFSQACAHVRVKVKVRQWQVFDLYCLKGISSEETARVVGCSAISVKMIAWRVRRRVTQEVRNLNEPLLEKNWKKNDGQ